MGLASRGSRNLDEGEEQICDPQELLAVRETARRINIRSAVITIAVTAVLLAV